MSFELVKCKYQVSRKAPGELVKIYPDLWKKLSLQRFSWLRIPWIVYLLFVSISLFWPSAIILLGLWVWQRNSPVLIVCRIVELLTYMFFVFMILGSVSLINIFYGAPFMPIFIVGFIVLLYEGSSRSWHYLFNYMSLTSSEFLKKAILNNWILEDTAIYNRTQQPIYIAVFFLLLGLMIVGFEFIFGF